MSAADIIALAVIIVLLICAVRYCFAAGKKGCGGCGMCGKCGGCDNGGEVCEQKKSPGNREIGDK